MGCVNSKPKDKDIEPISIDQLKKELFQFNKNTRGYLKRKNNFCLKKVPSGAPITKSQKTQNPQASSSISAGVQQKSNVIISSSEQKASLSFRNNANNEYTLSSNTRASFMLNLSSIAKISVCAVQNSKHSREALKMRESSQEYEEYWMGVLYSLHPYTMYHPCVHYTPLRVIGQGGFGKVILARHVQIQDKEYAIKAITLNECSDKKSLAMEIHVLCVCNHENILTFLESFFTGSHLYIVTEYVFGVSLLKLIEVTEGLREMLIASVLEKCLQGLAYLHSCAFIHCDIKSDNILIGVGRKVKIADFGLAVSENEEIPKGFRGTQLYVSPEMANSRPYGREVDIWGMGIVAIEMAQGSPPLYDACDMNSLVAMSKSGYNAMKEETASKASEDFKDFLYNGALKYDPADRLTAIELLNHPFMLHGDSCGCLPFVLDWVMRQQSRAQYELG